jgi:large exoprotein involved in heme utilization and adhesion
VDSTIESSVQGDVTTAGGDVSLDPDFIILQNSQILAKAVQGQGGNITLIANDAVLVDPFSVLDASSALGVSGSVNIQAPIQNLSGTIVPLPQDPVPVTALYGSRCVAGAGGHFSTFVDSKADSLAPTPGTFLASPFLPLSNASHAGALGHARIPAGVYETGHAAPLQVAAYSPPVLFGQGDEMLSACP